MAYNEDTQGELLVADLRPPPAKGFAAPVKIQWGLFYP